MRVIKTDAGLEYMLRPNESAVKIAADDPEAEEINAVFGRDDEIAYDSMKVWKGSLEQGFKENLGLITGAYKRLNKADAYNRFHFFRSNECWFEFEVELGDYARQSLIENLDDSFVHKDGKKDYFSFIYSSGISPIYFVNIYDSFVRCGGSKNVAASLGALLSGFFKDEQVYVKAKYLTVIETLSRAIIYVNELEPEKKELGVMQIKDFEKKHFTEYELGQIHFPPFWMIPDQDLEVNKL